MGIDDLLSGKDFFELSVIGRPAHPFRLGHVVPMPPSALVAPQLEGVAYGS
jgi:hypothetical protein